MERKLELLTVVRVEALKLLRDGEKAIDPIAERLPAEWRREFYGELAWAYASKNPKRMVGLVLDNWVRALASLEEAHQMGQHAESA